MVDRSAVLQSVYRAIDIANEQLPAHDAIVKTPTTPLYGGAGALDSLGLISLVFALEKRLEADFGRVVSLMAESTIDGNTNKNDPFRSVDALVDWLVAMLEDVRAAA